MRSLYNDSYTQYFFFIYFIFTRLLRHTTKLSKKILVCHRRSFWNFFPSPLVKIFLFYLKIIHLFSSLKPLKQYFFLSELSSNVSVSCLQFCRWTVSKIRVGELSPSLNKCHEHILLIIFFIDLHIPFINWYSFFNGAVKDFLKRLQIGVLCSHLG